jgi:cell division protein FtsN
MNRLLAIVIISTLLVVGCKTAKTAKKTTSAYQPAVENVQKLNEDNPKASDVVVEKKELSASESPIIVRSENIFVAKGEDQSQNDFSFYVIIGSFANSENAGKLKDQLVNKGFSPVIMQNENGMYRVSIKQTNAENEARETISEIRSNLPEHKDVWLLKKK